MKIVHLRKEDLPSEGRVIEQIYALARIFHIYIFYHKYEKCMYSSHYHHCCIHIVTYIDVLINVLKDCMRGSRKFCQRGSNIFIRGKRI